MIAREQHDGIDTFRLPKSIYSTGALKTLSGNAIALFLVISYRMYRARLPRYDFSFRELFRELELGAGDICKAAKELHEAKLIHWQQEKNIVYFQIQAPDGSKARSYLRRSTAVPEVVIPETDVNAPGAQTN
jgi:hypothetical protein